MTQHHTKKSALEAELETAKMILSEYEVEYKITSREFYIRWRAGRYANDNNPDYQVWADTWVSLSLIKDELKEHRS